MEKKRGQKKDKVIAIAILKHTLKLLVYCTTWIFQTRYNEIYVEKKTIKIQR